MSGVVAAYAGHSIKAFPPLPITVFLRPQRNLESIDPQFTIRRKMEQLREEKELVEQLREVPEKCPVPEWRCPELKRRALKLAPEQHGG